MNSTRLRHLTVLLSTLTLTAPLILSNALATTSVTDTATIEMQSVDKSESAQADINPVALQMALRGYHWAEAHGQVKNPGVLTVVDFTLPSNEKRMFVIDTKTDKVIMKLYVAHGKNSGGTVATHFSNDPGKDESSLGVFTTENTYFGHHGLSLRINGLEKGINDNAFKRAVVVHSAWYVDPSYIQARHEAGRSWGCFAVSPAKADGLINLIKDGSVIFAYAPQEQRDPNLAVA